MTTKSAWTHLPAAMVWLLLSVVVAAAQLPPEIQADRYLLEAERAIHEQDFQGAKTAMDAILELQAEHDLELPEAFSFRYAEVLERLGIYDEAIEHVTQYLTVAGRDGEYYREALELLDSAEETSRRVQAERELAEAARRQAEAEKREFDELVSRQVEAATRSLPPDALKSGGLAPQMVTIASGRFQYFTRRQGRDHLPWVEFDTPFAISKYEVTREEFESFVDDSRHRTDAERGGQCDRHDSSWKRPRSWKEPTDVRPSRWNLPRRFDQTDAHPVVCVSPRDAMAYAEWLSEETGHRYRLPSAAEWQYAARAGSDAARLHHAGPWDTGFRDHCGRANLHDGSSADTCPDGVEYTAEVGQFPSNDVGVHDMIGNVAEWVMACIDITPDNWIIFRREDGARENPDRCGKYVASLGDAYYHAGNPATHAFYGSFHEVDMTRNAGGTSYVGFRVVREIENERPSP